MRDTKQPRAKAPPPPVFLARQRLFDCILDNVLTVDDRTGQTRAVTMQLGAQIANQREKFRLVDSLARPRSCRLSFEHGDPGVALEPNRDRRVKSRIGEDLDDVFAKQRGGIASEPVQKDLGLDTLGASVGPGARPANPFHR